MNKSMHALLLVLFMGPAIFASPSSQAMSLKTIPLRMIMLMKNCFTPEIVKATALKSAQAFWHVAKIGAVVTVLSNICMPDRIKQYLGGLPLLGKFIFGRDQRRVLQESPHSESRVQQGDQTQLLQGQLAGIDNRLGRLQDFVDRHIADLGRLEERVRVLEVPQLVPARTPANGSPTIRAKQ